MTIRTQKYAQAAYPKVAQMQKCPIEAEYRTLALSFPTMIMQSGLAQAIGFLMAKDKDEHRELLHHIAELMGFQDAKQMHAVVLESDLKQYQLLTRKALDACSWLKRYTQALLKKKDNG